MAAAGAEVSEATAEEAAPVAAAPKRSNIKLLLVVLVLCLSAGGAYFLFSAQILDQVAPPIEGPGEPIYVNVDPPFVVNLEDSELLRFLQVELKVMTRDPAVPAALELHAPVIRNNLLLLFASTPVASLASVEGKVALQRKVTSEINAVLLARAGGGRVQEAYFTSFVMQ